MDIKCPVCGEPWDMECLHDEVAYRHANKPWYVQTEPENKTVYDRFDKNLNLWYDHSIYEGLHSEIRKEFTRNGCVALTSYTSNHNQETVNRKKNAIYGQLMELFGDDIDATAVSIEDYDNMMEREYDD